VHDALPAHHPRPHAGAVACVFGASSRRGQTGVDRAALDAAIEYGILIGGWCPKGRLAEDGFIPPRYPLIETPSWKYPERTMWNVRDSDGTLVLITGPLEGGSAFTARHTAAQGRPHLVIDLELRLYDAPDLALEFIAANRIAILTWRGRRNRSARESTSGRTGCSAASSRMAMAARCSS
jgi:hypothetical protein